MRLYREYLALIGLMVLAACSQAPRTDAELTAKAQQAVDRELDAQATFSLMESVAAQNIACGHASVSGAGGRSVREQDFVYRGGKLIMDDDPDFDTAAVQCDVAAGGGSIADADNAMSGQ
jgi:hypothetical protein